MVRLGIIGTNFITDWMLAAKELVPELVVTALYSRTRERGAEFAAKYAIPSVYTDLEAFSKSAEFDAVYIASPTFRHYDQAKLMLEQGKHVLCEKPATTAGWQVQELVALAREKSLVFLEAMRLTFDDSLEVIRQALPQIGRLRRATLDFCQYSSRYDRVRAGETGINAFDPGLGNAALMDMGCYCIHGLIHLFGRPERVMAHSYFLPSGFEAGGTVLLAYPGFTAEAVYSKVAQQAAPSVFLGEDGAILMDSINHTKRIWLQPRKGEPQELPYREKLPNNLMFELREFANYVQTSTQPTRRNQESLWTLEVMDQVRAQTDIIFPPNIL